MTTQRTASLETEDSSARPQLSPALAWTFGIVLVSLPFVCYWNALEAPFVFDDADAITDNPQMRAESLGAALENPRQSPLTGRPLVAASFYLNYQFGELEPFGYHLVNVAAHSLTALVVWLLLGLLLAQPMLPRTIVSRSHWLAFAIALLWTTHPLHTDAITYTVQRTELFMALFYVTTLYCGARAWYGHWAWMLAAVVACALGMLSKEVMVSAPLAVVLMDRALHYPTWGEALRRRRLFYGGLALTWLVLWAMVSTSDRTRSVEGLGSQSWNYLLAQCEALLTYLKLSVWPSALCLDYGLLGETTIPEALPGAIVVLGLLAATVWAWRKAPPWAIVGSLFFLVLAPTSSIMAITSEVAAERRMHLPLLSVLAALVLAADLWLPRKLPVSGPTWSRVGLAAVVLISAAYCWRTVDRNRDYASEVSIWTAATIVRPDNPRAHQNLGVMLHKAGDLLGAERAQRAALELNPKYPHAHVALGDLLRDKDPQAAQRSYRRAIEILPYDFKAHTNLGVLLYKQKQLGPATHHLREAIKFCPWGNAVAHRYLASVLAAQEDFAGAITQFKEAIRLRPDAVGAGLRIELAWAYLSLNNYKEALDSVRVGLAREPQNARLLSEEGRVLGLMGQYVDAQESFRLSIAQDATSPRPRILLAKLHVQNGSLAAAAAVLEELLAIQSDHEDAQRDLLAIYKETKQHRKAIALVERILDADPGSFEAKVKLGVLHATVREHAKAVEYLRPCVEERPDDAVARFWLGLELVQGGHTAEGLKELEDNARRNPKHRNTRVILIDFYKNPNMNRPDKARVHEQALRSIDAERNQ